MQPDRPDKRPFTDREIPPFRRSLADLLPGLETHELIRWMIFSLLIGIVAGLGALAFNYLTHLVQSLSLSGVAGFFPPLPGGEVSKSHAEAFFPAVTPSRWLLLIIPAVGGLVSGYIVFKFAPEAEGHGTDAMIAAYHNKRGYIRPIVPFVKLVASAITIGTGGSAGREGPIAQIGAGFGSFLGRRLKLPTQYVRLMVLIGAAAGIGAIFRAPLGATLFSVSVLYRETDHEYEALMPGFIASIVAFAVFTTFSPSPFSTIFTLQSDYPFHALQLPFYGLLGVAVVPVGFLYVRVFYGSRDRLFKKIPGPRFLIPALGGLLLGLIAFWFPYVLGSGYGWLQKAIDGEMAVKMMVALAFLKIVATSLTISSGGSGGVFAPSLVIGGMTGGVVGQLLNGWNPELFSEPSAFILVGMAAFFSAVAKVPIAALIMVSEMTGGYDLLVPATLAIAVAYILSGKKATIFENQVLNRLESPAHRGEYVVDVLKGLRVSEVVKERKEITVQNETTLSEIYDLFASTEQAVFPVVNRAGEVEGIVPIDRLRYFREDPMMYQLVIANDVMERPEMLRPEDNLDDALQKLLAAGTEELPVLSSDGKPAGYLSRRELLAAYYKNMREIMKS